MQNFEEWKMKLNEAEAAALSAALATNPTQPITVIDQALQALCQRCTSTVSIEEAYKQLLTMADDLCRELAARQLVDYQKYVETQIEQLRQLHESGETEQGDILAHYLARFWSLSKGLWATVSVVENK
jgi:hypothetical protein